MARTRLYRDLLAAEAESLDLPFDICCFERLAYLKAAARVAASKRRQILVVAEAPDDSFYHMLAAARCVRGILRAKVLRHRKLCTALDEHISEEEVVLDWPNLCEALRLRASECVEAPLQEAQQEVGEHRREAQRKRAKRRIASWAPKL